jgi:prepilin-type N-terminal cleavage/methylation domain-containing protein
MDAASICPLTCRHKAEAGPRPQGFSLLEMMMVVTLILIVASIATPIYRTCATRAREAVLRDHLFTSRARPSPSPPRKRGSMYGWIPACAGMTGT